MVSTKPALGADDSEDDLVSGSNLGKMFRSEGPRHTPVQQGLTITQGFNIRTSRLRAAVVRIDSSGRSV